MTATVHEFRRAAAAAIADPRLQSALEGATGRFRTARAAALAELPDAEALRDHFKAVRAATLARLAEHLETFERNATAAGAHVHWATDGAAARRIVVDIAQRHGVRLATKSKSMATEEIHLNQALQAAGVEPVETDLGEWIIQLAGDPPFHIVAPAIHKTRQQVAEMFSHLTGEALPADDIPRLTAVARRLLRAQFLAADLGISGANLLVAETGSVVLVTNEGNGRMVTSLPRVHVAVVGIEKVAPTWDDAACWLALLARSATGQPLSIYTSVITGPRRPGDPDGPDEVHIVLLDNGRSRLLGTEYEEVLQCIRCSACLNICPVYREAGGHAYGNPYSGPIGAVVAPLLFGLEEFAGLPHASSLCGACRDVCPARIDLPRLLLALRRQEVEEHLIPWAERMAERSAAAGLAGSRRYALLTGLARLLLRPVAQGEHLALPESLNLGRGRRLPTLAPRSFHDLWASGELDAP
ncbi:MAG: LutB/LldF family L-lactate oxidation iron-sulfur protein [Caldilineales bacterium]|nr:LutB/LldF family L-lactate oxidation iron-sulfur protein [Caldilineales bacterium]